MAEFADISLFHLSRALSMLDQLADEQPDTYEDFVREMAADCTLVRDMLLAIGELSDNGADPKTLAQADHSLRQMIALWVLLQDITIPLAHFTAYTDES
ncbi:MAG: hypothetical protein JG774_415 [Desulfomicrobiaceae bacterium]|jgi:hypothetical protein|nr:hypothetical protein [Desulfomicrobiaceae bacterium]MBZ4648158.1 hypothetical protein [Desulfomicrobiaceae bacterium]MBZ4684670.1 hypothetical protein [Desulfomicrobiaceae bacterium]MDI3492792.1 hypothetical protein [Desulfomicrobiaceae bacterium]MDK2872654.1 hypothetical protein [Desulfomicrobiaceae bacterium]